MFEKHEFEISGNFTEDDIREKPDAVARSILAMESSPEAGAVWMVAIRAK